MNLGYGDFVGNENFGPSTERALKAFQADNNLVVNGIGDPVTLRKLEELETPSVLKRGDNNPAVKELKLDLARLGFVVSNNPNNIFGPTTEKTVKEFQSYYGISPDGVVGSETFGLIESILNSPLQRGRSSPEAVDLKNSLMNLGYGDFVGNENFGPSTERALKAFQADNNLVVNGIGDPVTLRKLEELETPSVLKRGDNNPAVKELKLDLARLGFVVSNNPNNIFGPTTEKTVKEFQSYYGISPDGVVGSETFRLIESILNSPLQRGRSSPEAVDLKNSLMNLGYGDFVGNENFGPSTERALKALQADNNLVVNGIGDPVTLRKLEELETPSVLKRGDNNPAVKELKLDLARLGFVVSNNPNNIFGPTTEKTVKEFQSYYGISPDGVVGSETFRLIESILNSPLQRGRSSPEAVDLKNSLMNLGYGDFVGNENFGPSTERALKALQADNNLVVNGIGDPVTLRKLEELETPSVLKRGDNNPAVKELKLDLARLGFVVSNNPNNIFGPTTEKTVKEFQSYYGISPDGVVGSETFGLIESILNSPLQRGRSSPEAVDLKNSLMNLGYGDFVGNENFGPSTERALKAFQADTNLVVNGIGDPVTLRKLEELETPSVLKRGDNNPAVKELKLDLARLGFVVSNNPNNIFGPTTEKTVKEFQSYYGISPDGVVGSETFGLIESILNSPLQRGRSSPEAVDLKNSLMNL